MAEGFALYLFGGVWRPIEPVQSLNAHDLRLRPKPWLQMLKTLPVTEVVPQIGGSGGPVVPQNKAGGLGGVTPPTGGSGGREPQDKVGAPGVRQPTQGPLKGPLKVPG